MAAAWILLSEVLTKKIMFWQGKPYFWIEKTSILRGFSKLALTTLAQGSKEWTWTSFTTFMTNKKNENIFANFCQRREHIVNLNSVTFFRLVIPQDYVDLYRGSHSPCASADFGKYDEFWRQIMLASLTKFR